MKKEYDLKKMKMIKNPYLGKKLAIGIMLSSEVITYFVEQRPDDERIRCGALLRAYDKRAWTMSFVFLDATNAICASADGARYGQTLRFKNLDAELMELFSGKDLIVLQGGFKFEVQRG